MNISHNMHSKLERPIEVAQILCAMLGEVGVNPSGTLREPFGPRAAGAPRERVYEWLEDEFPYFYVGKEHERDKSADAFKLSDVLTAFCLAYVNDEPGNGRPFMVKYNTWLDPVRNMQAHPKSKFWPYDAVAFHYTVQFAAPTERGVAPLNTEYSKGIGHGKATMLALRQYWPAPNILREESFARLRIAGDVPWEISSAWGKDHNKLRPTPMETLWCLCEEGFGARDRSFAEWASDYGMSDDSITAKNTYEACVAHYDGLVRVFGHARMAQLERWWNDAENDI